MYTGSAPLLYGVFVTTWTLLVAARAHSKLVPALLALDLIALRENEGRLEAMGQLGCVPRAHLGDMPA